MQGVVDDWHQVVLEEKIAVENQGFVDCVLTESLYIHIYIYIHMCMIQSLKHGGTLLLSIPKLTWNVGKWGRPELLIIVANNLINYGC